MSRTDHHWKPEPWACRRSPGAFGAAIPVALLAAACAGHGERAQAPAAVTTPTTAASSPAPGRLESVGDYEVRIRDGSKYYCRSDLQTGSRVMMVATCLTEAQYVIMQDETRQTLDRMRGTRPTGGSSSSGAN